MTPARGVPSTATPNSTVIASRSPAAYSFVPSNGSQYTATLDAAIGFLSSGAHVSSASSSSSASRSAIVVRSPAYAYASIVAAHSKLSSATRFKSFENARSAPIAIASTRRSASVCASATYVPSARCSPPLSRAPTSPPSVTSRMIAHPRRAIARMRRTSDGT